MLEHHMFRAGVRVCGVFFLGWFCVDIPGLAVELWRFVHGLFLSIRGGYPIGDGPFGALVGILLEVLRLIGNGADGIVAWFLLTRGDRLVRRLYPEAASVTPATS